MKKGHFCPHNDKIFIFLFQLKAIIGSHGTENKQKYDSRKLAFCSNLSSILPALRTSAVLYGHKGILKCFMFDFTAEMLNARQRMIPNYEKTPFMLTIK